MAHLNIDDNQMQTLVAAAALQVITPESRDKLIGDAILNLLTPPTKDRYSQQQPKSVMQEAFERAVQLTANEVIRDHLESTGVKEQIKAVIVDATVMALETKRDELVANLASGIAYAFTVKHND